MKILPENEQAKFGRADRILSETPSGFFYYRDDDPAIHYIRKNPENIRGYLPGHKPKREEAATAGSTTLRKGSHAE